MAGLTYGQFRAPARPQRPTYRDYMTMPGQAMRPGAPPQTYAQPAPQQQPPMPTYDSIVPGARGMTPSPNQRVRLPDGRELPSMPTGPVRMLPGRMGRQSQQYLYDLGYTPGPDGNLYPPGYVAPPPQMGLY